MKTFCGIFTRPGPPPVSLLLVCLTAASANAAVHYQLLRSFGTTNTSGTADEHYPQGRLIQGGDGAFYGTCSAGGAYDSGTVFRLKADGRGYLVLHTFADRPQDGFFPSAELVAGSDAALYGVTPAGGTNGAGTVFKLNRDGSNYRILYNFGTSTNDGQLPAGLIEGSDGTLYGSTSNGGPYDQGPIQVGGTVFRISRDGSG